MIKKIQLAKPKTLAIMSLVLVALGYAALSVVVRLLDTAFEPSLGVALRVAGGLLLLLAIFRTKINFKKVKTIPSKDWRYLLLMGAVGYAMGVYFVSLAALKTSLFSVAVTTSTVPIFSYALSLLVLRQKFDARIMLLAITSVLGVSLVAGNGTLKGIPLGSGEFYGLLFALGIAVFIVGRQKLSNHLNTPEISAVVMAIAAATALLLAFADGKLGIEAGKILTWQVAVGLLLGSSLNVVATVFETYATKVLSAVMAAQLLLTESVFGFIIGYLFYEEQAALASGAGALIVIASVYVTNRVQNQ